MSNLFGSDGAPPDSLYKPKLLVLEPVDLARNKSSHVLGQKLRMTFSRNKNWRVTDHSQMEKKFSEYSKDVNTVCREFACAFDAGNIFHANLVVFSSITHYQNLYVYNLIMIDIKLSQVVWSGVGDVFIKPGDNPDEALLFRLENQITGINPAEFKGSERSPRGTMSIFNLGEQSTSAQILFDRLAAHTWISGQYELMGQRELGFLMESLDVTPAYLKKNRDKFNDIGKKLGLDYIIGSDLIQRDKEYSFRLSFYDIKKQNTVRDWPFQSHDFKEVLEFENKFFASLNTSEPASVKIKKNRKSSWKWITSSVGIAASGALAYLSYRSHQSAEDEFKNYQQAKTLEELKKRSDYKNNVEQDDLLSKIYGGTAGLVFAGSMVLWIF